jgi:CSLREA domain-containing protein
VLALLVATSIGVLLVANTAYAANFVVNRTGDAPDANINNAACDSNVSQRGNQCTLRAAIQEANDTAGADQIRFNIVSAASVKTISPTSALPTVTEQVTINGYTQPGASPNTLATGNDAVLKVQLNGTNAGTGPNANGLVIEASNSTVRGLVINRFDSRGIVVEGFNTTGNRVQGTFIGTNAGGTSALGNEDGVDIQQADDTTVGGTASGSRNVISSNRDAGIQIVSDSGAGNEVLGNYIGTNKNGTSDLGNSGEGVHISDARNSTVGGTVSGARNVISGNNRQGVLIQTLFDNPTGNKIEGNFVGTSAAGTAALGNGLDGVQIAGAADNTVGGTASGAANRIAHNGEDGVSVSTTSKGNRALSNVIFSNTGLGIDLGANGVTNNDTDDPDTGANNLQNFPVITSAIRSNTTRFTTISGTLNSNPSRNDILIQCFVAAPDPLGHGEGQIPIAQATTSTNANGDGSFACVSPVPQAGQLVTATATVRRQFVGDTSEFSENVGVVPGP